MSDLEKTLQRVVPLATQLRHELHAHPELSGQEVWTKQRLMDFLRDHSGLELFDRGHYFLCVVSRQKRCACDCISGGF